MKLPWFMFALLLAMGGIVCAALVKGETSIVVTNADLSTAHGFQHDQYATMQQGGSSAARFDRVEVLAIAFALLQVVFLVSCVAFGIRDKVRRPTSWWPIIAGGILFAAMFCLLFVTYRQYADQGSAPLFGSLPLPTAVMIYGVCGAPFVFIVIYIATFDRWVVTPEDLERFREIVEARRRQEEEGD